MELINRGEKVNIQNKTMVEHIGCIFKIISEWKTSLCLYDTKHRNHKIID